LSLFDGIRPIGSFWDTLPELVSREKPLVPEASEFLVELRKRFAEELLGCVSAGLAQGGVTDALSLSSVNIREDGGIFTAWTAKVSLAFSKCNDENRIYPSAAAVGVRLLEELFRRPFAVVEDDYLQRTRSFPLIELEIVVGAIITPWSPISGLEET
jgi:hypothetical protein